jgi:hypothetical protein
VTDSEQSLDLDVIKTASDLAFGKLEEGIAELTAAFDEWDANGSLLTQTALERVESLNDPAYGGLREQTAADLTNELARLPEPREPLVPGVNLLLLALQMALLDLAIQIKKKMSALVEDDGALKNFGGAYVALITALFAEFENPARAQEEGGVEVDAALDRAMTLSKSVMEPVETYKVWMTGAILATDEVSGALQVAAMLLTARLNLLLEFLDRTDPPAMDTSVARGRFVRTFIKAGVSETAAESLKQVVEFGIEELAKEVAKPLTFGLSVLYGTYQKVREKREALQKEQERLEELAKVKVGPGPSDYMWMLSGGFRKGATEILELVEIISDSTKNLQAGLAPGATD